MGDRAIFGFRNGANAPVLYLYSHWGGEEQEQDLAKALFAAHPRWSDESYATRICVSHLIGDQWDKETGFGLSVGITTDPDYDYHYIVDWFHGEVIKMVQREYDWEKEDKMSLATFMHHNLRPLLAV